LHSPEIQRRCATLATLQPLKEATMSSTFAMRAAIGALALTTTIAVMSPASAMPAPPAGNAPAPLVQNVYWQHWGYWRPWRYRYRHAHYWRPHSVWRCWPGAWGYARCGWVAVW
jgi:hypothetical protein